MKARGKKIRQINKPRTVYGRMKQPYERDKMQEDRYREIAEDIDYNYNLSQKSARRFKNHKSVHAKEEELLELERPKDKLHVKKKKKKVRK